jgi:hypothetical protein
MQSEMKRNTVRISGIRENIPVPNEEKLTGGITGNEINSEPSGPSAKYSGGEI